MKATLTFSKTPKSTGLSKLKGKKATLTFKKKVPVPIFKNGRILRTNPNHIG